jgi:hypothetical protein
MSQHDLTIANQGFPAFRSDLNNALQALGSTQAGSSAPSPTFAHQMWIDTSSAPNVLKVRNADNDAWITVGQLNQTADTFNLAIAQGGTGASTDSGARTNLGLGSIATQAANNVTITGGSITGITDITVADGGTGRSSLTAENVLLGDGTNAVKFVAPGTNGNVLQSNGTTWTSAALSIPAAYAGVNAQVFTANGTFTIPTGITRVKVTVVGGGGGSGGTFSACIPGISGGGGGGGTAIKWLTSLTPGNTLSVTVGAGGTAGAATPGNGGAGGNSSVASGTQSITTITGNGGGASNSANQTISNGGAGGTATNGDTNIPGLRGKRQLSTPSGVIGGDGGSSLFGFGGLTSAQTDGTSGVGIAGSGYGGGAGGSASNSGQSLGGAAGSAGVVIFEW